MDTRSIELQKCRNALIRLSTSLEIALKKLTIRQIHELIKQENEIDKDAFNIEHVALVFCEERIFTLSQRHSSIERLKRTCNIHNYWKFTEINFDTAREYIGKMNIYQYIYDLPFANYPENKQNPKAQPKKRQAAPEEEEKQQPKKLIVSKTNLFSPTPSKEVLAENIADSLIESIGEIDVDCFFATEVLPSTEAEPKSPKIV